jgi:hypothetical protein
MIQNKKYELEEEIREIIHSDNKNSAHFEYTSWDYLGIDNTIKPGANVKLITLNKKTGASFLLIEIEAKSQIRALLKIKAFLLEKSELHSFTIKWYTKDQPQERPFKSKFSGVDIEDAIRKFYHGKNKESFIIYSISDDNIKSKEYEG